MNLLGVINDRSYGVVCYNLLKELKCKFWPLFKTQEGLDVDYQFINECLNKPYENNTSIRLWHQFDLANHVCSKRVGFPIFELDNFNKLELEHLRAQDQVLVCSRWAQSVLANFKISANVVPLGVDTNIFYPIDLPQQDTFKFFCCGKWEIRKGHDFLVQCFDKAFHNTKDVELYMSCHNPFLTPQEEDNWQKIYKNRLGNQVIFTPWAKSQKQLNTIMNTVDCGIFLSRAEGWNLEALEMMACNKPIIITNYSGHTEFCNNNNSYLVHSDKIEKAIDGKWFFGQGNWLSLDNTEEQVIEHMRFIYKNRPKNPRGLETAKQFSWTNSANLLKMGV